MDMLWLVIGSLAVLGWRAYRREAGLLDAAVWGFVILHFLLVEVLLLADWCPYINWRYHQPTFVLLTGYVGWAAAQVCRRWGWMRFAFAGLLVAALAGNVVWSVRNRFLERKNDASFLLSQHWAADVIRSDWKGPKSDAWTFDPVQYRTNGRPVIDGYATVAAYLIGGRMRRGAQEWMLYPEGDELPDYVILFRRKNDPGNAAELGKAYPNVAFERVAEKTIGRIDWVVYRRSAASKSRP